MKGRRSGCGEGGGARDSREGGEAGAVGQGVADDPGALVRDGVLGEGEVAEVGAAGDQLRHAARALLPDAVLRQEDSLDLPVAPDRLQDRLTAWSDRRTKIRDCQARGSP